MPKHYNHLIISLIYSHVIPLILFCVMCSVVLAVSTTVFLLCCYCYSPSTFVRRMENTCHVVVCQSAHPLRVRIKLKLNVQMHCLFRIVEDFFFPEYLPEHGFEIRIGDTTLVASLTPRTCWGASNINGVEYLAQLVLLPPPQGESSDECDDLNL